MAFKIDQSFLKGFRKNLEKYENVAVGFTKPGKWYHTGNFALNKILSGVFTKGIPQRRITALAGPSGCIPKDEKIRVYVMKSQVEETPVKCEE